ncbi:MAG: alkaline phosphatase family protein, partial [Solirubrobacteraceae bacterium]
MDRDDPSGLRSRIGSRCANCGARLATDQRYCLSCGTRRGPLPAAVDSTLHEMRAGPVAAAPLAPARFAPAPGGAEPEAAEPGTAGPAAAEPEARPPFGLQMPTPRVASLLVMAVLSFGVVAGSLTGPGGVEALAHSFVISLPPVASAPATTGAGSAGSDASGGGSQQAITETITEPTPSGGGGATTPAATTPATGTGTGTGTTPASGSAAVSLPPIKHVFVVMLSDQGYTQSFVATHSSDPYLSSTLRKQGELVTDYYGVASSSLASEIALLSGQGPTQETAANCPVFNAIAPTANAASSQVIGNGCVYPQTTGSLPAELTDNGNTWRGYIQGIDQGPAGTPKSCRYPTPGSPDPNQAATATDPYVTRLNPFVYFAALTSGTECAQDDVGVDQLATDLKQVRTTPNLSYIAPDACHNGSDTPCMAGAPAGLAQADAFLKTVIPEIEASPAYKQDGMIIVTFDQAPQAGPNFDATSCCDQPTFPNLSGAAGTTATAATTTDPTTSTDTTTSTTSTTTGTTTAPGTTTTAPATSPTDTTTTITTTAPPAASGTATTATGGCPPPGTRPGGGQVGALVISRYVKAGTEDGADTFNPFSLLKTIEDLFSIPKLGYAKDPSL